MEYSKQQFLTYDDFTRQFACDYSMPLARGGHGEIYRGVDLETNEEVAIKRRLYSIDDNALTLEKEYANTQAVPPNRFVVRYLYYGRYATPFGTYEFLVMRFYRDGNLTSSSLAWTQLTANQQQRFVNEFLQGLHHLHTHNIVHRDIKPENVLLVRYTDAEGTAFRPVIADFGISKMMTDHPEAARAFVQNSMRIGTVTYMAPEQLRTENIDYNADLWSFGIILYELITSKLMIARRSFPETQREEAYEFWRNAGEDRFPDDMRRIPQPYQQIIRKCLVISRDERVQSARELLNLLAWQPDLLEAEQAFRRQDWAGVIHVLEPIMDRVAIPDVSHWLQQARLQQALNQPDLQVPDVKPLPADAVQATHKLADSEPAAEVKSDKAALTPSVEDAPATKPEVNGLAHDAADSKGENGVDGPSSTDVPAATAAVSDTPEYDSQQTELFDTEPVWTVPSRGNSWAKPSPAVPTRPTAKSPQVPVPAAATTADTPTPTPEESEPDIPNPAQTELFEPASALATAALASPFEPDMMPVADRRADMDDDTPVASKPVDSKSVGSDVSEAEAVADPLFADEQAVITKATVPDAVPKAKPPVPPATEKNTRSDLVNRVQVRIGNVVERAGRPKNRTWLIGGGLVLGLLYLFSVGSNKPADANVVQLDPKESYETSLKRFRYYSRTYEKTGQLNPYVWAFVHCNPPYDDSLMQSVVRRAGVVLAQHQLIFATDSGNVTALKRVEMRKLLNSKIGWEVRPHPLSDENCLPRK